MSNEELAARIQAGERELIPELWERVRGFVRQQAWRRFVLTGGYGGVEVEDLAQSGFLALLEAVEGFRPEEGCSFITFLSLRLKAAFAAAGGYRTSKRDPLNSCASLDAPVGEEDSDTTLLDFQADPVDRFETVERELWLQQLHGTLEAALDTLPERERELMAHRYWSGATQKEAGERAGLSASRTAQIEQTALKRLRGSAYRTGLAQFVEERTPYHAHVGTRRFNATYTSAVELAVLERERLERVFMAGRE